MERFVLSPFKADSFVFVIDSSPELTQLPTVLPQYASNLRSLTRSQKLFLQHSPRFRIPAFRENCGQLLCDLFESTELNWKELYRRIRSYPSVQRFFLDDASVSVLRIACTNALHLHKEVEEKVLGFSDKFARLGVLPYEDLVPLLASELHELPTMTNLFDFSRLVFDRMNTHEVLGLEFRNGYQLRLGEPLYVEKLEQLLVETERVSKRILRDEIHGVCQKFLTNVARVEQIDVSFSLSDVLKLLPQTAELFLRMRFTVSVERTIEAGLGFNAALETESAILRELQHVMGDRGNFVYSTRVAFVSRRLLFTQYQHCELLRRLEAANVDSCSHPLWFSHVKFFWSDVRQTVVASFEGHDVEYGYEISDWMHTTSQKMYPSMSPDTVRLLIQAHRTADIVELPADDGTVYQPLPVLLELLTALAYKCVFLDCREHSCATLCRAVKCSFKSGIALVLTRFADCSPDTQFEVKDTFSRETRPLLEKPDEVPEDGIQRALVILCTDTKAEEKRSVPTLAPHLMCYGLPAEHATRGAESLVSAAEFFRREFCCGGVGASAYGDFGDPFLRGVATTSAYLAVEEPRCSRSLQVQHTIVLALHMNALPRLALKDRSRAMAYLTRQHPGIDLQSPYSNTFRFVAQAIEGEIARRGIPLQATSAPIEEQDDLFIEAEFERRDQYILSLQCYCLSMLLFPKVSDEKQPPFAATVIVGPGRGGKRTVLELVQHVHCISREGALAEGLGALAPSAVVPAAKMGSGSRASTPASPIHGGSFRGMGYGKGGMFGSMASFELGGKETRPVQEGNFLEPTYLVSIGGSVEETVGYSDVLTGQWVDGSLTAVLRQAVAKAASNTHVWVAMRGKPEEGVAVFVLLLLGHSSISELPAWAHDLGDLYLPNQRHHLHLVYLLDEFHASALPSSAFSHCYVVNLDGLKAAGELPTPEEAEATHEDKMQKAFNSIDSEGRGYVTIEELRAYWREVVMGESEGSHPITSHVDDSAKSISAILNQVKRLVSRGERMVFEQFAVAYLKLEQM